MKNIIMPMNPTNMVRRNGSASAWTSGARVDEVEKAGRGHPPGGAEQDGQSGHREERLVHDAVDLVGLVRSGKPRPRAPPCR